MCGNRVEELESRVQELEASVRGLTDELVESKVRLRELEDAYDELTAEPEPEPEPEPESAGSPPESDPVGEDAESTESEPVTELPGEGLTDGTEVLDGTSTDAEAVADEADDEAAKAEETEATDEAEETEQGSDIIVA